MKTTFTAFGSDTLKITIITTEILENSKRAFILFESTTMKFRMRSVGMIVMKQLGDILLPYLPIEISSLKDNVIETI